MQNPAKPDEADDCELDPVPPASRDTQFGKPARGSTSVRDGHVQERRRDTPSAQPLVQAHTRTDHHAPWLGSAAQLFRREVGHAHLKHWLIYLQASQRCSEPHGKHGRPATQASSTAAAVYVRPGGSRVFNRSWRDSRARDCRLAGVMGQLEFDEEAAKRTRRSTGSAMPGAGVGSCARRSPRHPASELRRGAGSARVTVAD
jgi:hypothetical protein